MHYNILKYYTIYITHNFYSTYIIIIYAVKNLKEKYRNITAHAYIPRNNEKQTLTIDANARLCCIVVDLLTYKRIVLCDFNWKTSNVSVGILYMT